MYFVSVKKMNNFDIVTIELIQNGGGVLLLNIEENFTHKIKGELVCLKFKNVSLKAMMTVAIKASMYYWKVALEEPDEIIGSYDLLDFISIGNCEATGCIAIE